MKTILDIMRKNRKVQALLLALIAVIAADAGFYMLRTAPESKRVIELEERSRELRQGVRKKSDDYRRYASFDRGRADIESFKGLLPRRSEYIGLIRQVMKLAKEDGVKSEEFGIDKSAVQQEGGLEQLSFSMPVTGSYGNVRKFIYDVERSDLFLSIDNLDLSSKDDSDDVSLSIGLSTYVRS